MHFDMGRVHVSNRETYLHLQTQNESQDDADFQHFAMALCLSVILILGVCASDV